MPSKRRSRKCADAPGSTTRETSSSEASDAEMTGHDLIAETLAKIKKAKKSHASNRSGGSSTEVGGKADVVVSPVADKSAKEVVPPRNRTGEKWVDAAKSISNEVIEVALKKVLETETRRCLVRLTGDYEALIMSLVAENAKLRGKVEGLQEAVETIKGGLATRGNPCVSGAGHQGHVPAPVVQVVSDKPVPKPVETWSLIVRSKNQAVTSKEIVSKVVGEVGPTLGVRVHEVKPIRGGGAIIRTPSKAEREKVVKNAKFQEVGLDVSVNEKLGPRVVVQGVHRQITPHEFMEGLYDMNFKELMTLEAFKKDVKLVSKPWEKAADGTTNVVLEGSGVAMEALLTTGRCYIQWYAFRVRPFNLVPGCFRCLSFDHRVAECRVKADVCRRCGQQGHRAVDCVNAIHCRNCAFKGRPAGHLMMSAACPVYGAMIARANARH